MFKTFLVLLILPPMNLVLLAAAGLAIARFRPRLGWAIGMVSVAGLLLLSFHAVSHPILAALEQNLPTTPNADNPPTAIVVLAGDVRRSPSVAGGVLVGPLTLERLRTAAILQRKTGLPVLVSGGEIVDSNTRFARLMTDSLTEDFRIPVRWSEAKSRDTWENARFSAEILKADGVKSIYVVTHAWHMRRSVFAFSATGLTVTAAPTPLQSVLGLVLSDFIPSVSSWQTAYFAFHEWVGALWYGDY